MVVNIDRGSRDGIRRDMGVITPDGVVGKILAVYPDISQVLLLGDKESGVGALLADTRTQGPVKGTGEPLLSLDYISNDEKVSVGEAVLTSGQDRIFPKDLPVGTVVDVDAGPQDALHADSRKARRPSGPPRGSSGPADAARAGIEERSGCRQSTGSRSSRAQAGGGAAGGVR